MQQFISDWFLIEILSFFSERSERLIVTEFVRVNINILKYVSNIWYYQQVRVCDINFDVVRGVPTRKGLESKFLKQIDGLNQF